MTKSLPKIFNMDHNKLITIIRDKSLSTREIGDALEEHIMDTLELNEVELIQNKGSGSVQGNGDIKKA